MICCPTLYNPVDHPLQSTEYTVTVTSAFGCTNTASVTVNVTNPPAPLVHILNMCGESQLTASGYSGTLVWSNGSNNPILTVTDNTPLTVYYISGNCTSEVANVTPAPVEIPEAPTVTDVVVCYGETYGPLTATSNYSDIVWYSDANLTNVIGTGSTYQSSETNPGTYNYYVVAYNDSCASPVSIASLTINDLPIVIITQNGDTLYSSSSTGNQWYTTQGPISGANDSIYIVTVQGNYYVVVTDTNGCSAMSEIIHVIPTAMLQQVLNNQINIMPNPASDYVVVKNTLNNARIQIITLEGKVLHESTLNTNLNTISLKGFAKGMYQVRILSEQGEVNKKLVVE